MKRSFLMAFAGLLASTFALAAGNAATTTAVSTVAPGTTRANAPVPLDTSTSAHIVGFLHNYVEVGTRLTFFSLQDANRSEDDAYLGHLNELDAKQNVWPIRLFGDFVINPYLVVELTYDQVKAKAHNSGSGGPSDGSVSIWGPIATLQVRYPIQERFVPYLGIGYTYMFSSFAEEDWWAEGWKTPEEWAAANGAPNPDDVRREMRMSDAQAPVYVGGFVWYVTPHLAADFLLRYMDVTTDADFYRYVHGNEVHDTSGSFAMSNIAYGFGARYSF